MFLIKKDNEIEKLIEITKSNSGVSGPELCETHIKLGKLLAKTIKIDPKNTTVVAIMRGGMFFAQGIYFELGCKFSIFNPKLEEYRRPDTKYVILVDSVINTGKSILPYIDKDTIVACNIINEKAVEKFECELYAVRISSNSFVGKNVKVQNANIGPDTTSRLFNII